MSNSLVSIVILAVAVVIQFGVSLFVGLSGRAKPFFHDMARALAAPASLLIWVVAAAYLIEIWVDESIIDDWVSRLRLLAVVAAVAWFLIRLQRRVEKRAREELPFAGMREEASLFEQWGRVGALAILMIALLVVLQVVGIDVSAVIAFGGFGALAIGIAGRELFANLFGGRMLFLSRAFLEGERIRAPKAGVVGVVQRIGWYQTTILVEGESPLTIPNAFFMSELVINESRARYHERHVTLRVEAASLGPLLAKLTAMGAKANVRGIDGGVTEIGLTVRNPISEPEVPAAEVLEKVRAAVGPEMISLAFK